MTKKYFFFAKRDKLLKIEEEYIVTQFRIVLFDSWWKTVLGI